MNAEMVHIGFGSVLAAHRVIAVVPPGSAPIKRMVQQGRSEGKCIDATRGRKPKAVVIMDDGHIVLAAITPETIAGRVASLRSGAVARAGREESES